MIRGRGLLAFLVVALSAAGAAAEDHPAIAPKADAEPNAEPKPNVEAKPKPKHALYWHEEWRRFHPVEYVATGILGPLAIAEYFYLPPQQEPHWVGGILFDDAVRDSLRLRSPSALHASWAMADTVGVSLVAISVGLDSIIVPLLEGSPDVAWQLTLMDAEAFSLSSLVAITLYDTVGRARPSYEDCQRNPSATMGCNTSPAASFPSGHINEAFTAAGLSCAHHMYARVYGSRFADAFACARDLTLATTEGVLRIMGDRHWTTDVIVGSMIGFSFGFGLPTLLHYMRWRRSPVKVVSLAPMVGSQIGVVAVGLF